MPAMSSLRPATLHDLDAVYALETAGFAPGIVETKPVFARRIAAFGAGFLVRESALPDWSLEAYFCTEIWTGWPPGREGAKAGGSGVTCGPDGLTERFALNHDIGAFHDPSGRVLYLASMTVAPPLRGRGAGRALFRDGLAAMRGAFPRLEGAALIVNEAWTGARAIYSGEGFTETGRLPAFFHASGEAPRAAIVMEARF
jgi:ribosomal protein S18 acetylase RimI-like enzyme